MKKFHSFLILSGILLPMLALSASNIDVKLVNRLKGQILLQVQQYGEAWYLNPKDGKRYYLKDGVSAYEILRKFGLGISNADLEKIPVGTLESTTSNLQACIDELKLKYPNITPGGLQINFNDGVTLDQANLLLKSKNLPDSGGSGIIIGSYVSTLVIPVANGQELQSACLLQGEPMVRSALPYLK